MVPVAGIYMVAYQNDEYLWIFLCVKFFATTYAFVWDFYIDFGFFKEGGKLRTQQKMLYPRWFYIFAIFANFFMRYLWLAFLFKNYFKFKGDDDVDFGKLFKV